ncbi:hypothetical protein TNCV_2686231 [Trichonephila clavipes]|nr:hypothetical protein TNCV_2686231 [Trichonephila clavipes]
MCPDDLRRRVWGRPRLAHADTDFTIVLHTGPQARNCLECRLFDRRTHLVIVRFTRTEQRYVDDILRTVFLPFFFFAVPWPYFPVR